MKNIKERTCIVCPVGCLLKITMNGNAIEKVEGNTCPRGEAYAMDEMTAPKRMLTTTVRAYINGKRRLVPVKTSAVILKSDLFAAMEAANAVWLNIPGKRGDVALHNLLGVGVDLILTDDIN